MPSSTDTKRVIVEFIEIYRTHPCLWQVKHIEYHDPHKKEAAYSLLIEKLREIEPNANKSIVARKIHSLRSNVLKEKKKYEASLKSKDIHYIKLWYYDLFNFLHDPDGSSGSCSTKEPPMILELNDENDYDEGDNITESWAADQQYLTNIDLSDNNDDQSTTSSNNNLSLPAGSSKRKAQAITNKLLPSVQDNVKRPRQTEDRCDIFSKNVAIKLRALATEQMLVAEKLINDLLFEAEMGHLTSEHAYINMGHILGSVSAQQEHAYVKTSSSPSYSPNIA